MGYTFGVKSAYYSTCMHGPIFLWLIFNISSKIHMNMHTYQSHRHRMFLSLENLCTALTAPDRARPKLSVVLGKAKSLLFDRTVELN